MPDTHLVGEDKRSHTINERGGGIKSTLGDSSHRVIVPSYLLDGSAWLQRVSL